MPYPVVLEQRVVVIHDKTTTPILNFLQQALLANNIKLEEDDKSPLVPGEEKRRPGWWARIISVVEKVTSENQGSKCRILSTQKVNLDPPAYTLRNYYVDLWNSLLIDEKLSATDTEQKEISNATVLIYEILIRLVTIALSANFDSDHDGDTLLNVIANFTENIVKIEEIPMSIRIFLVTEHHDWLACLRDMVAIIKSIHSNAETFTKTLAYLEQAKLTIVRQLIIEFDQNKTSEDLGKNWLKLTLHRTEDAVSGKPASTIVPFSPVMDMVNQEAFKCSFEHDLPELSKRQIGVVDKIQRGIGSLFVTSKSKSDHVRDLYLLLSRANLLIQVVSQIDLLCTTCGWVPLITGALKVNQLVQVIEEFQADCNRLLKVSRLAPLFQNQNNANLIAIFLRFNVSGRIDNISLAVQNSLLNLNNAQLLRGLFETVSSSIDKLSSLQKRLGESVKIIDDTVISPPALRSPASTSPSHGRESASRALPASGQASSPPSVHSPGAAARVALESQLRPEERPSPPPGPHVNAQPKRP